ncbi:hypothetical protein FHX37_3599 [Haloactinospora alba]|uniref:Uncharacterized protein n=1 Tax=Haloactinospora alba TaxID=405555 RepID=A0A543NP23_9ACTN|nr:hypothetical protein [Haloactinospora alba]TQN33573.1 hypothetical protein FHX37_3599 [Haloactinospora alba]
MDLLDYYRGTVSARRLRVLLRHLPRDSALARAVHGDAAEWGVGEHLLALAADHLATANWLFVSANSGRKQKPPPRPDPVPRPEPGAAPRRARSRPEATAQDLRAFFGAPNPPTGNTRAEPERE